MSYIKRLIFLIGGFFLLLPCYAQMSNQNYFFQEIGWTITLPLDFSLLDMNDYSWKTQAEEEQEEEMATTQTMLVAIKDRFNYFNITITPFDEEEKKTWSNSTQTFKEQVYRTMAKNVGKGQIDTASSVEFIDGLAFDKFHISMTTTKGVQLNMYLLAKLYKGYDFAITYLSLNEATQKEIELMLRSSRFN